MLGHLGDSSQHRKNIAGAPRGRRIALAAIVVSLLALGPATGAALATTYNVTTVSDPDMTACTTTMNAMNACSLREALLAINATPSPPDVIQLGPGNYTNTQAAAFPITQDVSIVGAGSATTTINGAANQRAIEITGAGAHAVSISGVTITGGHGPAAGSGGGIFINLTAATTSLQLDRVALVGNVAGSGGGLAEFSPTAVTITNSLVANNKANSSTGFGGGIYSIGALSIVDSTVTGNTAGDNTGTAQGGGFVETGGGAVTLANSTVAGNTVSGIGSQGGNITLSGGTGLVSNSIIAYGLANFSSTNDCELQGTTVTSGGYNVEERNQCSLKGPGDQVNTDPGLGQLPATLDATSTLALSPLSPAINAGNPAGCAVPGGGPITVDQRGVTRPQGARCDAGAFEFRVPALGGAPSVSGTAAIGQALTCSPPSASSPDGGDANPTFAWLRGGTAIAGATNATYMTTSADGSQQLACRYALTNLAGSTSATSAALVIVGPPALAGAPSITGSARVGQKLTCNLPNVSSPNDPVTGAIAWLRDGTAITGATGATYTVLGADSGHKLACRYTATNSHGSTSSTSPTVTVGPPPSLMLRTGKVKIDPKTGTGTVTATCTAPVGDVCTATGGLYGPGKLPAGVASAHHKAKRAQRLGTISGTIAAGATGRFTVKLNQAALNLLLAKRTLTARLSGKVTDHAGQSTKLHSTLTLKVGGKKK